MEWDVGNLQEHITVYYNAHHLIPICMKVGVCVAFREERDN